MTKTTNFNDLTEQYLRGLVEESERPETELRFDQKLDMLKEMINWVKVKNKVDPEKEEGSKIDEYRNILKAGDRTATGSTDGGDHGGGDRKSKRASARIAKIEEKQNRQKLTEGTGQRNTGTPSYDGQHLSGDSPNPIMPNGFVSSPVRVNGAGRLSDKVGRADPSDTFGKL